MTNLAHFFPDCYAEIMKFYAGFMQKLPLDKFLKPSHLAKNG
jgi:hypothetical protein